MTKPRYKPKQHETTGMLGDGGIRLGVQYVGDYEEEPPPREPVVPSHKPTRSDAECRELARRQRAGEDLGLSDAFVDEWAPA